MPTLAAHRPRTSTLRLERETSLVPIAAARQVVEEASRWLGTSLPGRYAARLALQACRIHAHSPAFRRMLRRPGDAGRDCLWRFMRHWLATRLQAERPELYCRLPHDYALGADLPASPVARVLPDFTTLSPAARLLAG